MLSRFHLIPKRYGQTDRQTDGRTDRIAISISRVSVLMRDKNVVLDAGQSLYIPNKNRNIISLVRNFNIFQLSLLTVEGVCFKG